MEDDDIAMCGEGTGSINAKEKDGYVKEYIETEGLAMILSKVNSFYGSDSTFGQCHFGV